MNAFETVGLAYLLVLDIIILIGNVFVLGLICFNAKLRNPTGFLMANLMVCDMLLGCLIPVSINTIVSREWTLGELGCTIIGYAITVANCAANWALCLVSIERYMAIIWPFKHKLWSKHIKHIAGILWGFILIHNAVMFHYADGFAYIQDMYMCGPNLRQYPLYVVLLNVFDLLIPNVAIVFTYIKIYREVQRHNRDIAVTTLRSTSTKGESLDQEESSTAEWKAALVIIAIVGVFNVCWIPFGVGMLVYALNIDMPYGLAASLFWIALTNAGISPLIYTMLNKTYREEIGRLIRWELPIQRELSAVSF